MRALPDVAKLDFDIFTGTFIVDLSDSGKSAAVLEALKGAGHVPTLRDTHPKQPM